MKTRLNLWLSATAISAAMAAVSPAAAQTTPFIGQIRTFGADFCPDGWAPANGALLPIQNHVALFSLLSTRFGGDGQTNFALPDLRGRIVIGPGQGPGLSNYAIGDAGGSESVTLDLNHLPAHAHGFSGRAPAATETVRTTKKNEVALARSAAPGATESTQSVGGGQAHENRQPFLAVTTCIAMEGIFPAKPGN